MVTLPNRTIHQGTHVNIYAGTFLISFTSLVLEIALTRLLSVIALYHLAFFAVSVAMLGMTAGAVIVFLKPNWFEPEKVDHSIAKACLAFAIITPCSLFFLTRLPIVTEMTAQNILNLVQLTIACLLPFCCSGIAITAVLTKHKLPIGRLYASDLAGASLGCLFVLGASQIMTAPSLIVVSGFIGALATVSFASPFSRFGLRQVTALTLGIIAVLSIVNIGTPYGLQPLFVKGKYDNTQNHVVDKWNSFSRVVVYQQQNQPPALWGPGTGAPTRNVLQYYADIDGGAGTFITQFKSQDDIDYLRYDISNIVHYVRPSGNVCIIGSGGGRDSQSAILFGHKNITAIDVNSIFINLLQTQFKDFAGIGGRDGVNLVADEARSYIAGTPEKYSVIQMSLVDTWAASAAGAFTLSENGLYTIEAWQTFYNHLTPDGIFTASRHYMPATLDETGRMVSLAAATLLQEGVNEPSRYIAVMAKGWISTLLMSKQPFSAEEISQLHKTSSQMGFDVLVMPGEPPQNKVLGSILSAKSVAGLKAAVAAQPLNFLPTTDENPYFFNMLRLNHLEVIDWSEKGVLDGNISATYTLAVLILILLLISIIVIIGPLAIRSRFSKGPRQDKILWSGALYFALIGAGFMFVEMGLIQRLSVFLGNPLYGLGVLLFTIIASAGIGSFFSDRLPLVRQPWIIVYPVCVAVLILAMRFVMPVLGSGMAASPIMLKIIVSIGVMAPLGVLMGVCFPVGMRLVRLKRGNETPWYWALNGTFGVLCSALAVFVSIYVSISASLYIGVACYTAILFCIPGLLREQVPQTASVRVMKKAEAPRIS